MKRFYLFIISFFLLAGVGLTIKQPSYASCVDYGKKCGGIGFCDTCDSSKKYCIEGQCKAEQSAVGGKCGEVADCQSGLICNNHLCQPLAECKTWNNDSATCNTSGTKCFYHVGGKSGTNSCITNTGSNYGDSCAAKGNCTAPDETCWHNSYCSVTDDGPINPPLPEKVTLTVNYSVISDENFSTTARFSTDGQKAIGLDVHTIKISYTAQHTVKKGDPLFFGIDVPARFESSLFGCNAGPISNDGCGWDPMTSNATLNLSFYFKKRQPKDATIACGNITCPANGYVCLESYQGSGQPQCFSTGSGGIDSYCKGLDGLPKDIACNSGKCDKTTFKCDGSVAPPNTNPPTTDRKSDPNRNSCELDQNINTTFKCLSSCPTSSFPTYTTNTTSSTDGFHWCGSTGGQCCQDPVKYKANYPGKSRIDTSQPAVTCTAPDHQCETEANRPAGYSYVDNEANRAALDAACGGGNSYCWTRIGSSSTTPGAGTPSSGGANTTPGAGGSTATPASRAPATRPCQYHGEYKQFVNSYCGGMDWLASNVAANRYCTLQYTDKYICNDDTIDDFPVPVSLQPGGKSACSQSPWCTLGQPTPKPTDNPNCATYGNTCGTSISCCSNLNLTCATTTGGGTNKICQYINGVAFTPTPGASPNCAPGGFGGGIGCHCRSGGNCTAGGCYASATGNLNNNDTWFCSNGPGTWCESSQTSVPNSAACGSTTPYVSPTPTPLNPIYKTECPSNPPDQYTCRPVNSCPAEYQPNAGGKGNQICSEYTSGASPICCVRTTTGGGAGAPTVNPAATTAPGLPTATPTQPVTAKNPVTPYTKESCTYTAGSSNYIKGTYCDGSAWYEVYCGADGNTIKMPSAIGGSSSC